MVTKKSRAEVLAVIPTWNKRLTLLRETLESTSRKNTAHLTSGIKHKVEGY